MSQQRDALEQDATDVLVTVLMPCLNEAPTLAACIQQAHAGCQDALANRPRSPRSISETSAAGEADGPLLLAENDQPRNVATLPSAYEIVIADNGSTDGSPEIATENGARVVHVPRKGYGAALMAGIAAAQGKYVVMGDSDCSYDFRDVPRFIEKLEEGSDLVVGNRFAGGIMPGAMPWHHRYIGNPVLSGLGRLLYRTPVRDWHCGLRGCRRQQLLNLGCSAPGMEFASEMIIRASRATLRVAEVPTALRPDGRAGSPHLRSFRDGWRHLQTLLCHALYSPQEPAMQRLNKTINGVPAIMVCIAACLNAGRALAFAPETSQVSKPERKLLDIRSRMSNFTLDVSMDVSTFSGGKRDIQTEDLDRHWIADDGWRMDMRRGGPESSLWYREFAFDGRNGFYSNEEGVVEWNRTRTEERPEYHGDPRMMGLGFQGIRNMAGAPGRVVGEWVDSARSVSRSNSDAGLLTMVEYETEFGATYKMFFLDNPLRLSRLEMVYQSEDGNEESRTTDCKYMNDELRAHSFPSEAIYNEYRNGVLTTQAVERIQDASFKNSSRDLHAAFTLKALGVPKGRGVIDMSSARQGVWTGDRVLGLDEESVSPENTNRGKYLFAILSISFALAFSLAKAIHYKRQRLHQSP